MLRWFEHRQVFSPLHDFWADASELGRPHEEVQFHAEDRTALHGWFFPASSHSPRRHLALLLLHGNAGNISTRLEWYQAFLETGASLFTFDYRGYGRSAGQPSEAGSYLDAQAAWHWLHGRGFQPNYIVALGKSLGGGVASELALRQPLGGLVLHNTFTSIPDLGQELFPWLPVRRLARIHYSTHSKLPRIKTPLMIIHSRDDQRVRLHHGQRNFAVANEPKIFWEISGGHSDAIRADRQRFLEGLETFMNLVDRHAHPLLAAGTSS